MKARLCEFCSACESKGPETGILVDPWLGSWSNTTKSSGYWREKLHSDHMSCFPFDLQSPDSLWYTRKMGFRARKLLCQSWVPTIYRKKETRPYRGQSQPLGEHRPFAPKEPRKESQEESEQTALYFANGWVWNSGKQEKRSCSFHSEERWAGDLWHLGLPGSAQALWPWPLNIPGSWSQALPGPRL